MYISIELLELAFTQLHNIDSSQGKSRQEKISAIRYLLATSKLLKQHNSSSIDLSVDSPLRGEYISAVGEVVALDENGLYSKDFHQNFDQQTDYGVTSNFLTTRLSASRAQHILYPGRPKNHPLLSLDSEQIEIVNNAENELLETYGISNTKPSFCIWLLRNEDINIDSPTPSVDDLHNTFSQLLSEKFTTEIANSLTPSLSELSNLLNEFSNNILSEDKPDQTTLVTTNTDPAEDNEPESERAKILENTLPDEDETYALVEGLLSRGSKGILFSGPPGTSKSWYALKIALKLTDGDLDKIERVQFHSSFTYEDFIEGLVSTGSTSGTEPLFTPKLKVFLELCEKAREDLDNTYFLVIDEFSRGDPSKIFGELLTYIEPDYRDINFKLPYSGKEFSIPQNIVILATMNPYDKSVIDIDAAMERRLDVIELLPDKTLLRNFLTINGIGGPKIGKTLLFFDVANDSSPHGFGHTYFKAIKNDTDFIFLWNHKLKFIFKKMFIRKEDAFDNIFNKYKEILNEDNQSSLLK